MELSKSGYEILATMLRNELEERQIEACFQVLQHLPVVNLSLAINGRWETAESLVEFSSKKIDIAAQSEGWFVGLPVAFVKKGGWAFSYSIKWEKMP